jgi:hypothetical protein
VTTIDEHGNVQQWTAVYWRHFGKYTEECDSFAEAYRFLTSGEDYESLSSEAILGPDGAVLMDAAALSHAYIDSLDPDELFVRLSTPAAITAFGEDR